MKLVEPREFVKEYSIQSLICCFSGGKDSLVATHYTLSELEDVNIDKHVVYVDTGIMIPSSTPFVEKTCQEYNWNLSILYGHFFEYVKAGMPMPTLHRRWCCGLCKLNPIKEFVKNLAPQRAEVTGLRRDESWRHRKLPEVFYLKPSRVWKYAPIVTWSEKDVLRYMKDFNLPVPPHYKLGIKETCQCQAFGSKKQVLILKAVYPELFEKIVELEREFKKGGSAFYFKNKRCYARDIAKQKTIADYMSKAKYELIEQLQKVLGEGETTTEKEGEKQL